MPALAPFVAMSPALLLYFIRLLSALLLLGFVGVIAWLIYREMQITAVSLEQGERPQGRLRVMASEKGEPAAGSVYPLLSVTSLGRAVNNTIVLPDSYASSQHALIVRREGQWQLQDLGSRNGTLLNDALVRGTAVISSGDIITIGGIQLKVELWPPSLRSPGG